MDYKNSWRDSTSVFIDQLSLNKRGLSESYPDHWLHFQSLISKYSTTCKIISMVDIGCGSGSFSKFCKVMFPDISYTGMDYSPNAIGLSKSAWPSTDFFLKDFWSLTSKDMQKYDLIYEDALLDVLSNGDEALNHIMSLKTKAVFLNRVKNGPEPSHYTTYDAYGYLPTYSFYHNREKLIASIESNYKICTEISSPPYSSFCMIEPINPRESLCKN